MIKPTHKILDCIVGVNRGIIRNLFATTETARKKTSAKNLFK